MSEEQQKSKTGGPEVNAEQMILFLERVERLEEEKKGIADDVKDVWAEAKSQGYDTKYMKRLLTLRKMTSDERSEEDAMMDTYRNAAGLA
jgi:uncharacterized protein (UPF0335 family)